MGTVNKSIYWLFTLAFFGCLADAGTTWYALNKGGYQESTATVDHMMGQYGLVGTLALTVILRMLGIALCAWVAYKCTRWKGASVIALLIAGVISCWYPPIHNMTVLL